MTVTVTVTALRSARGAHRLHRADRPCAEAFGWTWHDAVAVALDGVEASWLGGDDKRLLSARIRTEAATLC